MEEETGPDSRWVSHQPLQAEPNMTAVAGEVRTLSSQPLEGVSFRIGDKVTRTDDTGRFVLTSISPGHHELLIDGRTASRPGRTYGVFEVGIDVRADRTNVLPFTIWMPEIDTANAVSIPSPTADEVVVTTLNIPGWELHLPSGTTIRDKDGHVVTQISMTPIPVDRPPFPLPFGTGFPMYFTVQPGGAYIEPYGARIIYPNITNESPGTRVNFWNYDPEEKGPLADTGTHTIVGDPVGSFFDPLPTTASLTLLLSEPVSGAISIDGSSVPITLDRPGQNARLIFEGSAGQRVSLGISEVNFDNENIVFAGEVSILRPNGTTLATTRIFTNGSDIDTEPLPDTGTYAIVVNPGVSTVRLALTLSKPSPALLR